MSAGACSTCQLGGAFGRPGIGIIGPAAGVGLFSGLLFRPTAASTLPGTLVIACSASANFALPPELVVAETTTFVVFVDGTAAATTFVLRWSAGTNRASYMVRRSLRVLSSSVRP